MEETQRYISVLNKGKSTVGKSKNSTVIDRTFGKRSVETIYHRSIVGQIPKILI